MESLAGAIVMPYTFYLIDGGAEGSPEQDMTIVQKTETSVEAVISDTSAYVTGDKYVVKVQQVKITTTSFGAPVQTNIGAVLNVQIDRLAYIEGSFIITGLSLGGVYNFSLVKKNGSSSITILDIKSYELSTVIVNGSIVRNATDPKELTAGKSYMTLSNKKLAKNNFVIATREFGSIVIYENQNGSYTYPGYYSFGTSLFMDPIDTSPNQSGGVSFFLNESAKRGYYLIIETTGSAVTKSRKAVRIVRADGTKFVDLATSQKNNDTTLDAIFGGRNYEIDIKVKYDSTTKKINITAYVNGFRITAEDTNTAKITPTNRVGVFSAQGTTLFDYVYARELTQKQYEDKAMQLNYYSGQFSNDLLDLNFGNTIYNSYSDQDDYAKQKDSVDEFGKVVREIVHVKTKLSARPAFPLAWSIGANQYAKIIASKVSNFTAEAYVLNNSSSTIPLQNGQGAIFYLYGNKLGQSGQIEYSTDKNDLYTTEEPLIFTSRWLQNEKDVKSIATWIKSKFVNRGRIISLSTFGNPMLNIGDIVTIKYAYEGLTSANKFIITGITHSYNTGLETSITCRSL